MSKTNRISLIDVETTGLDSEKHEILEIGLVIFEGINPYKILHTHNVKVCPEHIETAQKQALEVNGYTPQDWKDSVSLVTALNQIGRAHV